MTTDSLDHPEQTRTLTPARLGALAGVTPVTMFVSWIAITGWGGTSVDLIKAGSAIALIAAVTGWIVGSRSHGSMRDTVLGVIAYPTVAWLVFLPIGAISSSWPWGLVYGLVSSLYMIPLLMPFGIGWSLTYYALRRTPAR